MQPGSPGVALRKPLQLRLPLGAEPLSHPGGQGASRLSLHGHHALPVIGHTCSACSAVLAARRGGGGRCELWAARLQPPVCAQSVLHHNG